MKKIIILILVFSPVYVFAAKWKKISVDKLGGSQYIDIENIRKQNGQAYCRVLIDNLNPFTDGTYSSIGNWEVNCTVEKILWLSLTSYSQPMGKGEITTISYHTSNLVELTPNKVLYPKLNSDYYTLMKFVCDGKK